MAKFLWRGDIDLTYNTSFLLFRFRMYFQFGNEILSHLKFETIIFLRIDCDVPSEAAFLFFLLDIVLRPAISRLNQMNATVLSPERHGIKEIAHWLIVIGLE